MRSRGYILLALYVIFFITIALITSCRTNDAEMITAMQVNETSYENEETVNDSSYDEVLSAVRSVAEDDDTITTLYEYDGMNNVTRQTTIRKRRTTKTEAGQQNVKRNTSESVKKRSKSTITSMDKETHTEYKTPRHNSIMRVIVIIMSIAATAVAAWFVLRKKNIVK